MYITVAVGFIAASEERESDCVDSAVISVSVASILLIVSLSITVVIQCAVIIRLKKYMTQSDLIYNKTPAPAIVPGTVKPSDSYNIPVKDNSAYGTLKPSDSNIPVKDNSAYGTLKPSDSNIPVSLNDAYIASLTQ